MALQHLRSSTANKRPTPASMSDGQLALNTNDDSPGLFFKDSNGGLVKVGPVHVGATAPNATPGTGGSAGNTKGEQWLDTSGTNPVLKVWDGSAWQSEAGEFVNASGDVMTGALGIIAGSAASPGLYVSGDTNTGITAPAADNLAVTTGGAERLRVTSTGLIGAGTSSPAARLHSTVADGSYSIAGNGTTKGFRVEHNTDETRIVGVDNTLAASFQPLVLGGSSIGINTNGTTRAVTVDSSGNVTINGQGDLRFADADSSNWVAFQAPATVTSNVTWTLPSADGTANQVLSTNGSGTLSWATAGGGATDKIEEGNTSAEVIDTGSDGRFVVTTEGTERARVDSSGRLLVGTSTAREFNPSWVQRLQIEGSGAYQAEMASITYNDNGGTGPALVFGKTRGTASGSVTAVQNNDVLGKFRFFGANGTDLTNEGAAISVEVDGTPFSSGDTTDLPGRIVLSTTPDGSASPVERVRIASDGGVFINTTNTDPTANRVNGIYIATDNAIRCRVSGSGAAWNLGSSASAITHINFYTDNGSSRVSAGSILSNGSTTTYNTSSDYRLKENIVCLSSASDRLKALKPVQFEWKKGFGGTQPLSEGFIAHELQEVCPLAVQGTKDEVDADGNPVYQGIDQSKLVPLLTAALQEAIGRIETLEAKVAALEGV